MTFISGLLSVIGRVIGGGLDLVFYLIVRHLVVFRLIDFGLIVLDCVVVITWAANVTRWTTAEADATRRAYGKSPISRAILMAFATSRCCWTSLPLMR